jgi:peroxiredoxin
MAVAAPDFSLPDAAGKVHRLADLSNKPAVLVFFRGSGCLACNSQLNSFARLRERFSALGVKLVAVSSTSSLGLPEARMFGTNQQPFPSLLLADAAHQTFKRYGCTDASEAPLHGTFVLDGDGKIRWKEIGMEPYMDVEKVLAEVARLKP